MRRCHGLVALERMEDGLHYAACICGMKLYGDDEDEAFQGYVTHKRVAWLEEATG
jgi:hypothetical protein